MSELILPALAVSILVPLAGAAWLRIMHDPNRARQQSLIVCCMTMFCAMTAALLYWSQPEIAPAAIDPFARIFGGPVFAIDGINAPLIPLVALLFLLTSLASLHTRGQQFSFTRMLLSEGVLLALLSCKHPWVLVVLLVGQATFPWFELRALRKSTSVYMLHMSLFAGCLIIGQAICSTSRGDHPPALGIVLLAAAVLIRSGVVPLHCWMSDLFENASLRNALLFVTPMVGAYAAVRLVFPLSPEWLLRVIIVLTTVTALYAAGMALVQRESRRFFCYLFLSHSSLVLIGLGTASPLAITGALCVWISVALALTGFGLTIRAVEARIGRLSLADFSGLYEQFPNLAVQFLITGLASIGFPGTIGFVGAELLVDGAIQRLPLLGVAIVIGSALNGLAVLHAYFHLFTGIRRPTLPDLKSRPLERIAVVTFIVLVVGGGLYPQPGITSRYMAAEKLVEERGVRFPAAKKEHVQLWSQLRENHDTTVEE